MKIIFALVTLLMLTTPAVGKMKDIIGDLNSENHGDLEELKKKVEEKRKQAKGGTAKRLTSDDIQESEVWIVAHVSSKAEDAISKDNLMVLLAAKRHGYGTGTIVISGSEKNLVKTAGGREGDIMIFSPKKYSKIHDSGQVHLGKPKWDAVLKFLEFASENAERELESEKKRSELNTDNTNAPDDEVVSEIELNSIGNSMNGILEVADDLPEEYPLLLLFYSVTCPYCQLLSPVWEELGFLFFSAEGISIGKTACPYLEDVYQIEEYPTILLFTSEHSFVKYPHAFQLRPLVTWLKKNVPDVEVPFSPTEFAASQGRIFSTLGQSEEHKKLIKQQAEIDISGDMGKILADSWNQLGKEDLNKMSQQERTKKSRSGSDEL